MLDLSGAGKLADCVIAFLAFINPVSKIVVLGAMSPEGGFRDLVRVSVKASLVAVFILAAFALAGNALLTQLFHIQIHAFQVCGGAILFFRGYQAVEKGLFFEMEHGQKLDDISVVPLASPLIAGPAAITASVTFPFRYGLAVTLLAIVISILVNLVLMMASSRIGRALDRHHFMSALIRITGLLVASIGVQMILDGITAYVHTLS